MSRITVEEEYRRNPELRKEDVLYLQDWLSKQPHLPKVPEDMIILFLHSGFYKLEATKTFIEIYYTVKTHAPDLWSKRDPLLPEIQNALTILNVAILPKKDDHGNVVIMTRLRDKDASHYLGTETTKVFLMLYDLVLLVHGTSPGIVIIFDSDGFSLGHLAKINLGTNKKFLLYTQEAYPGRTERFHVINCASIVDKLLSMTMPFVKKELLGKISFHPKGAEGMESFFRLVPKRILPKNYGGDEESFETIHQQTCEKMLEHREWFIQDEMMRVNESKRPGKAKSAGDVFGLEGSFKKLDID